MTGVTLYELAEARDLLDEFFAESEGEVTPELAQLLDELQGKTDEKIERVALYIRERLATAEVAQIEAARLSAIATRHKRAAEGLKAYLKFNMEKLGLVKVPGPLCPVRIQNSPASVKGELTQEKMAELYLLEQRPGYVRQVPLSYALDRRLALDAHAAGQSLPVGLTVERGTHLRIG